MARSTKAPRPAQQRPPGPLCNRFYCSVTCALQKDVFQKWCHRNLPAHQDPGEVSGHIIHRLKVRKIREGAEDQPILGEPPEVGSVELLQRDAPALQPSASRSTLGITRSASEVNSKKAARSTFIIFARRFVGTVSRSTFKVRAFPL